MTRNEFLSLTDVGEFRTIVYRNGYVYTPEGSEVSSETWYPDTRYTISGVVDIDGIGLASVFVRAEDGLYQILFRDIVSVV